MLERYSISLLSFICSLVPVVISQSGLMYDCDEYEEQSLTPLVYGYIGAAFVAGVIFGIIATCIVVILIKKCHRRADIKMQSVPEETTVTNTEDTSTKVYKRKKDEYEFLDIARAEGGYGKEQNALNKAIGLSLPLEEVETPMKIGSHELSEKKEVTLDREYAIPQINKSHKLKNGKPLVVTKPWPPNRNKGHRLTVSLSVDQLTAISREKMDPEQQYSDGLCDDVASEHYYICDMELDRKMMNIPKCDNVGKLSQVQINNQPFKAPEKSEIPQYVNIGRRK